MGKSVAIIGAGIAGLSLGCYAQMNGYDTRIFEMHERAGGLCTAWKRRGFTFDGCIHWLVGSGPASSLHQGWRELGAVQGRQFIDHEVFLRFEGADGRGFNMYTDFDRLEQHMKELSPRDSALTEELMRDARAMSRFGMPLGKPRELYNAIDTAKMLGGMLPYMRPLQKWSRVSMSELGARFQDPLLAEAFGTWGYGVMPVTFFLLTLAWAGKRAAGYPIGGSLPFIEAIEQRYIGLGGKVQYGARVSEIIVEGNQAAGVRLTDGTEHRADYVVSAADGRATIFDMLGGRFVDDEIRGYYRDLPRFEAIIQLSLGFNRHLDDVPETATGVAFAIPRPITIGQRTISRLSFHPYQFDQTLAPEGKAVAVCLIPTDYDHWQQLRQDPDRYEAEKQRIADEVVAALDGRFPGLAAAVEARDVATPITYERYTGNWEGNMEGWLPTPATAMMTMKKTLPGLDRFYMVGQWVQPGGGLPSGLISGREVAQLLCHRDGQRFETSEPA